MQPETSVLPRSAIVQWFVFSVALHCSGLDTLWYFMMQVLIAVWTINLYDNDHHQITVFVAKSLYTIMTIGNFEYGVYMCRLLYIWRFSSTDKMISIEMTHALQKTIPANN